MNKEEIYEHLAQVYLGKKAQDKKSFVKKFGFPRLPKEAKVLLTIFAMALAFYTLTAFLSRRDNGLKANILFALNNSPIRIKYDLNEPFPQVKDFAIQISKTDIEKYQSFNFSIRGLEEGYPQVVKVMLRTRKNETSFQYIEDVNLKWKHHSIALKDFAGISDWTSLSEVAFVLEAWNVEKKKGSILIDDICFSK